MTEDTQLTGDALDERAAGLKIEGRSDMTADEKRQAIAKAEADVSGDGDSDAGGVGNSEKSYDRDEAAKVSHDDNANVADERAQVGANGPGPVGGVVDGMSRRSGAEVMQGHFCSIDRTAKGVEKALEDAGAQPDRDGYGVYLEPAEVGDDGYPTEALVRLRDDTHALIKVPYGALRPATAGGR